MRVSIRKNTGCLVQLAQEIQACNACNLRSPDLLPLAGVGPSYADIMLIGEAPTTEAAKRGEPFLDITVSGENLNIFLSFVGLKRDDVYITNVCKCPKRVEYANFWTCRMWLDKEIKIIQPKMIITLGGPAIEAIGGVSISGFRKKWGFSGQVKDRLIFHLNLLF